MSQLAVKKSPVDQFDSEFDHHDVRKYDRSEVKGRVEVEGHTFPKGSRLFDMSVGGAAVVYPLHYEDGTDLVKVGDEVILFLRRRAKLPGRIVRVFDGGFAIEFDWSLEIDRPFNIR